MRLQGNNMRKLTPKMEGEREEENKGMRKQRLANTLASLGAASKEARKEDILLQRKNNVKGRGRIGGNQVKKETGSI